jgi:hypothetical protein
LSVDVSGGYADELTTVVFASIQDCSGPPRCGIGAPYLTDQFGQTYAVIGGEGIGVGAYPIFFEPLRGAAATQGAHLTFHLPTGSGAEMVAGLSGALTTDHAATLTSPVPETDSTRGVTYAIVSLSHSAAYLAVHTRISGALDSVISRLGNGQTWPGVYLVDSGGHFLLPLANGARSQTLVNHEIQDETRIFPASSGTYRLVVMQYPKSNTTPPGAAGWTTLASWTVVVP